MNEDCCEVIITADNAGLLSITVAVFRSVVLMLLSVLSRSPAIGCVL